MEIETGVKFLSELCLDMAKIENMSCNGHLVKRMMHRHKNINAH